MELEEEFQETIKNSRMLGPTTFVVEDMEIDDPETREDFEKKTNFKQDRLWSIAPNAGAIVIAHQEDYDSEEGRYRCICVYEGPGRLIKEGFYDGD